MKKIILYDKQRQTLPLLTLRNKKKYIFINTNYLWFLFGFISNFKTRSCLFLLLLKMLNPQAIISYDWLTKRQKIYYLWSKKTNKNFIVVQHGVYAGGIVTAKSCKYTKCSIMYCWSDFYVKTFKNFNFNKSVKFINFGNPIYNHYIRTKFYYKDRKIKNILFLPTLIKKEKIKKEYTKFLCDLNKIGLSVFMKQHPMQNAYGSFDNTNLIKGSIYDLLINQKFDLIISDQSTSLLDAIFFKNKVVFFDPQKRDNLYSRYLVNVYNASHIGSTETLISFINIPLQEELLKLLSGYETKQNNLILG